MNLLAARVVLRPRALTEVLDLAVPFCLAGRGPLGRLAAAALLPAFALCLALERVGGWSWEGVWFLAVLLGDFLAGLFTLAAGELTFAEPGTLRTGALLGRFGRRLPAYLGAYLVSRLALAVAALFILLLPSVALRLLFVREAVLLEGASGLRALRRSLQLVHRQGVSCLGLLAALPLASLAALVAAELLGDAAVRLGLQLGRPAGDLFSDGGSAYALAGFFLAVPVTAAARFLKYVDIRTRKEGWDIQLRFMAIAERERAGRSEAA